MEQPIVVTNDPVNKKASQKRHTLGVVRVNDIRQLALPAEITAHALDIHQSLSFEALTSQKKKNVLFYLVYAAHRRAGVYQHPAFYQKHFAMSSRSMTHANAAMGVAIKRFPRCGDVPAQLSQQPVSTFTAGELLATYCRAYTPLPEMHHQRVAIMLNVLEAEHPPLRNIFPQRLAAAVLLLYMESNGLRCDAGHFDSIVGVKDYEATLKHVRKLLASGPSPVNVK